MKIKLCDLKSVAMSRPGLWDDFTRAGRIEGDCLSIERDVFERLNKHWFGGRLPGTMLHKILSPVAKASDSVFGTSLSNCANCAGRELKINAAANP